MVNADLQLPVQGQVKVLSCLRLLPVHDLQDPSHIVYIHGLVSLFSLEIGFHGGFDSRFSHQIRQFIIRIGLAQGLQLVFPDLSDIADDRGKILAVIIHSDRRFLDADP